MIKSLYWPADWTETLHNDSSPRQLRRFLTVRLCPPPLLWCEWIERKSFTFLTDKSCRTRPWTGTVHGQDCLRCSLSNLCKCWAPSLQQQTKIAHQHFVTRLDVCSAKQISIGWRLCVHRGEKKKKWRVCVWKPLRIQSGFFFPQRRGESELSAAIFAFPLETA